MRPAHPSAKKSRVPKAAVKSAKAHHPAEEHIIVNLASTRSDTMRVFAYAPQERIAVIRQGIPAYQVAILAERMHVPREWLIERLHIPRTTLNQKVREQKNLPQDESARVLGLATLIGHVETMLSESGIQEEFDVAQWLARWIKRPLPALGGLPAADYLDTIEGQKLISRLLTTVQSGAYS